MSLDTLLFITTVPNTKLCAWIRVHTCSKTVYMLGTRLVHIRYTGFIVQVKDAFNNLRKQGGDEIQSHLASVGTGAVVKPKIVDNGDGTYAGSFMPSTQGMYDLSVFLGTSIKTGTLLVESLASVSVCLRRRPSHRFERVGPILLAPSPPERRRRCVAALAVTVTRHCFRTRESATLLPFRVRLSCFIPMRVLVVCCKQAASLPSIVREWNIQTTARLRQLRGDLDADILVRGSISDLFEYCVPQMVARDVHIGWRPSSSLLQNTDDDLLDESHSI
jgi:hypothetical protein